jgi:protein-disulfide isomerase
VAHLLKKFTRILFAVLAVMAGARADAQDVLSNLPGFDFSRLPAPAKKELASVLTDEFDSCGRPLTLLASLKKGDACKHTRRMVGLAAALAAEGSSANEVIVQLSKYNQTFNKPRATFKVDERTCQGAKDAKVTLVEFSDFECPFCAAARPLLEEFVKGKSTVRLCWAPFPLSQHPHSTIAGQAALYARDGGKFWAVHDALFEAQLSMSPETIRGILTKAGLDVKAFDKAAAANKYVDELNASKDAGKTAGVDSTPSLFINGRKYVLGLQPEALNAAIDDELEWAAGNNAWPTN